MTTGLPLPPPLAPGDTLGIVAPASHFKQQRFADGLAVLEDMGFAVAPAEDLFARDGYFAGPDALRAAQVNRCFADDGIRGIIAARGGFGSMRLLPLLDIDRIRSHPKAFVGFSDVSALLNLLFSCRVRRDEAAPLSGFVR